MCAARIFKWTGFDTGSKYNLRRSIEQRRIKMAFLSSRDIAYLDHNAWQLREWTLSEAWFSMHRLIKTSHLIYRGFGLEKLMDPFYMPQIISIRNQLPDLRILEIDLVRLTPPSRTDALLAPNGTMAVYCDKMIREIEEYRKEDRQLRIQLTHGSVLIRDWPAQM